MGRPPPRSKRTDTLFPYTTPVRAAVPHTQYGNFAPLLPKLEARHAARTAHDKEFQWVEEDVEEFRAQRAKKYVSLNEAERHAERDRQEAKRDRKSTRLNSSH